MAPVTPSHTPLSSEGEVRVFAYVESNLQGNRTVALSHRNTFNLDLGFVAKVPDGFELVFDLMPEFKERGLEVYKSTLRGEGRAYLSLRNLGREIVQIRHQEAVATVRIVPVYELTFKVN